VERRTLLRPLGVHGFRLLFLSTFASSFGTLLAAVALAVDVKDRTDSGLWVGALMVVEFLPTILIGLALGPLLDRLSRRGLMVAADLARAAVFSALPFASGAGMIVALAAVAGLATGFFRPAAYAGIPNLVTESDLPQANSLLQGVENVSWTVGPVIGGVLTAAAGPDDAYWINAATFLVSALLIVQIPQRLLQTATALSKGHWRDLREGAAAVRRSRPVLTVLVAWSIASLAIGLGNVTEIFLAKDSFHAGDFGYGFIFGSIGLGLVGGSLVGSTVERRVGVQRAYVAALVLIAAGFALAAVSPNVWVAAVFFVVGGLGNGVAGLCNALLVQRGAPDELRGRALTLVMSANFIVIGLGMAIAGPLIDAVGARGTLGTAAAVYGIAAVVAVLLGRGVAKALTPGSEPLAPLPEPEAAARSSGAPL
jgi:MFS family permease